MIRPEEQGWRPIETAPRDWSNVVLYAEDPGVTAGYFAEDLDGGPDGMWLCLEGGQCHPTHWMPLPPPPVQP